MLQWGFEGSNWRLEEVDCDEDHCFRAGNPLDRFRRTTQEAKDAVAAYPRWNVLVPEIAEINNKDMIEQYVV
jgi:hypothetical protein